MAGAEQRASSLLTLSTQQNALEEQPHRESLNQIDKFQAQMGMAKLKSRSHQRNVSWNQIGS